MASSPSSATSTVPAGRSAPTSAKRRCSTPSMTWPRRRSARRTTPSGSMEPCSPWSSTVGGARAGSRRPRVGRFRAGRRHPERRSALAEQKLEEPVSAEVERYSIHRADCRPRRTIEQEVDHVDGSCLGAATAAGGRHSCLSLSVGHARRFEGGGQRGPLLLRCELGPVTGGARADHWALPCAPHRIRRSCRRPTRLGEVRARPPPSLLLIADRAGPQVVARPGCSDRTQAIALRRKGGRVGGGTRRGGSWANRSVVASAILRTAASKASSVAAEVDCTPLTLRTY